VRGPPDKVAHSTVAAGHAPARVPARVSKTRAGLSAGTYRVPPALAPAEIQPSTSTITSVDANTELSLIVPVADTFTTANADTTPVPSKIAVALAGIASSPP
jgi:hypothetical protein